MNKKRNSQVLESLLDHFWVTFWSLFRHFFTLRGWVLFVSKKREMAVIPKRIEKETQKLQTELPMGVTCKPTEENYR